MKDNPIYILNALATQKQNAYTDKIGRSFKVPHALKGLN